MKYRPSDCLLLVPAEVSRGMISVVGFLTNHQDSIDKVVNKVRMPILGRALDFAEVGIDLGGVALWASVDFVTGYIRRAEDWFLGKRPYENTPDDLHILYGKLDF